MRITVVLADFYEDIGQQLLANCLAALREEGIADELIRTERVSGALEIPMALTILSRAAPPPDALVALGCVIRGETYHFEVVSEVCANGILQAQMANGIPAGNGVLTVDDMAQALARTDKGAAAARAALRLAELARNV